MKYPLINMENHHFQWVNQLQMAIFNSYVSLPEGSMNEAGGYIRVPNLGFSLLTTNS